MKSDFTRKVNANRLKSEDLRNIDETSDWIIVRLNSKLKASELKYSDLLCKVHKFINDISIHLPSFLQSLSLQDQEKINSDMNYFLNTQDSLYSAHLFANFKFEMIEKLFAKDFTKEGFKIVIMNAVNDLSNGLGIKEGLHEKKKSSGAFEELDQIGGVFRDLTPVRNTKRSASPYNKNVHNYQKENSELKKTLEEVSKQRDLFKAWKENMLKNPNFDLTAQKIIKELREDIELLNIKNTCYKSKLAYLVNSVSKFLNVSSRFQRPVREKEGYNSINNYENEKHKLEVKLREVLENNDMFSKSTSFFNKHPEKIKESNKIIKRIDKKEEIFKNSNDINPGEIDKIRLFSEPTPDKNDKNLLHKLETENKILKSKYFTAKKELKVLSENGKNTKKLEKEYQILKDTQKILKNSLEKSLKNLSQYMQVSLSEIQKRIQEKDNKLLNFKSKFKIILQNNLKSLIAINEKADIADANEIQNLKGQIENLEYVILQNKNYSEFKIQELEEVVNEYENNKKINFRIKKNLEEEILQLTKNNSRIPDLEAKLKNQMFLSDQSNNRIEEQVQTIKNLQKFEILAGKYKFKKDALEKENSQIREENLKQERIIIEIQQELQKQADLANKKIEKLILEKNNLCEKLKKNENLEVFENIEKELQEEKKKSVQLNSEKQEILQKLNDIDAENVRMLKILNDIWNKIKFSVSTTVNQNEIQIEKFPVMKISNLKLDSKNVISEIISVETENQIEKLLEKLYNQEKFVEKELENSDSNMKINTSDEFFGKKEDSLLKTSDETENLFKRIVQTEKELENKELIIKDLESKVNIYEKDQEKIIQNLQNRIKLFEENELKLLEKIDCIEELGLKLKVIEENLVLSNKKNEKYQDLIQKLEKRITDNDIKEKKMQENIKNLNKTISDLIEKNKNFENAIKDLKEIQKTEENFDDQSSKMKEIVEKNIKLSEENAKLLEKASDLYKKLLLSTNERDIIFLELSKLKEHRKNFESYLKYRVKINDPSTTPERSMQRFELSDYKYT